MQIGQVETYTSGLIAGWAVNQADPDAPAEVDVIIDGEMVARLRACLPRLHGDRAPNGFAFIPPPALLAGRRRVTVAVTFADSGVPLGNSPRHMTVHRPARRVVCFSPNGRRVRHDDVLAYQTTPREHMERYANTGDWMVYDSSLKLLSFADLRVVNFADWTDKEVDEINAEYDYCFLRGSNYLHAEMEWRELAALLGRLRIPAVPFSVGAQAPARRRIELPQKSIELWKAFAGHCATIGVRGDYTAEAFNDIGIKNVEVIGCPSLFRRNDPFLRVKPKPWADIRRVAFSLRREVSRSYASDPARYLEAQKRMIRYLHARFDLTVTVHGEAAEKAFFYKAADLLPKYREELIRGGWFSEESDELQRIYENRLFYNEAPAEFDAFIRKQDFAVGFRVHGNLPALANGVAAICVDYDTRSGELADTFDIPKLTLDDIEADALEGLYRPDLFDRFNRNFVHHYRRLRDFLDRNGMGHNMLAV